MKKADTFICNTTKWQISMNFSARLNSQHYALDVYQSWPHTSKSSTAEFSLILHFFSNRITRLERFSNERYCIYLKTRALKWLKQAIHVDRALLVIVRQSNAILTCKGYIWYILLQNVWRGFTVQCMIKSITTLLSECTICSSNLWYFNRFRSK